MSDHLTPEDFFDFIDQGGDSGPAGHHFMDRPECLFELDFLLLGGTRYTRGSGCAGQNPGGYLGRNSSDAVTACRGGWAKVSNVICMFL